MRNDFRLNRILYTLSGLVRLKLCETLSLLFHKLPAAEVFSGFPLKFLFLITITVSANAQDTDTLGYVSLKPHEFNEEITVVNNPVIVDVREYFEYKRSRLNSAVNIPSTDDPDYSTDSLDKYSHIFLYCTSGFRSKRMARSMMEKGFIHVYSLDGGITAWKKEGLPVEKRKILKRKAGSQK